MTFLIRLPLDSFILGIYIKVEIFGEESLFLRVSLPLDKKDFPDSAEYLPMTVSVVNIFILKFRLKNLSRISRTPPQNINCRELWVLDNIFLTQIFITVFIASNIFTIIL